MSCYDYYLHTKIWLTFKPETLATVKKVFKRLEIKWQQIKDVIMAQWWGIVKYCYEGVDVLDWWMKYFYQLSEILVLKPLNKMPRTGPALIVHSRWFSYSLSVKKVLKNLVLLMQDRDTLLEQSAVKHSYRLFTQITNICSK